jgi:beta-glucosidase
VKLDRRTLLKIAGVGATSAATLATTAESASAQPSRTPAAQPSGRTWQPPQQRAEALVADMTLDEKIQQLHGLGFGAGGAGYAGTIVGNTRLGIPALYLADGPNGVGNGSTGVTQWPDAKTLASTWDTSALHSFGVAYGAEQAGKGHNVALAPCINILRLPLWGRSFETFTEDPYLNGQLVAAEIQGIQSQHVIATVKHYLGNNQETLRNSINDVVSRRALEEIYCPGFKAAVQQGGVGAVMTSYNKVNGDYTSENSTVLNDTLRAVWGFDGMVMSDWGGTHSTVKAANAGSDVEMPGGTYFGAALKAAVQAGTVSEATLNSMVTHVLTSMFRIGLFDQPTPDPTTKLDTVVSTPGHLTLARDLIEQGAVLLKNTSVLPLTPLKIRSIAVIGVDASTAPQTVGGGSGSVSANGSIVTPLQGITHRAGAGVNVTYAAGTLGIGALTAIPAAALGSGLTANYYASTDLSGPVLATETVTSLDWSTTPAPVSAETDGWSVRYTGTLSVATAGRYRISVSASAATTVLIDGKVVVTFKVGAESVQNGFVTLAAGDNPLEVRYASTGGFGGFGGGGGLHVGWQPDYDKLIGEAAAAAKKADVALVFVSDVTSEGMDRSTLALPADQNELIATVAAANPRTVVILNTSGAVLMPWLNKVASVIEAWYPGQQDGTALARLLFGDANPSGHLAETFPASDSQGPAKTTKQFPGDGTNVYYDEGIMVGYRWYDNSGEQPLFPFGHGLSYTTFTIRDLRLQPDRAGAVTATVKLTNTGRRTGAEVVQLYLSSPASAQEAPRQLKAFKKVEVAPGKSRTVTLQLDRDAFASWDDASSDWTIHAGTYTISVGHSSRDLPVSKNVTIH